MKYNTKGTEKLFFSVKSVLTFFSEIRGQNLTEFALCMVVIVTAFVSMQMYVQRNLQAKQKGAIEYLHSEIEKEAGNKGNSKLAAGLKNLNRQYEVSYKESTMTENTKSKIKTGFPDSETYEEITRSGKEKTKF